MRVPRVDWRVTDASNAMSGVMVSLAGEAVMRLPAIVPRLRICDAPTSQAARASGYARARSKRDSTQWLWVTNGPRWMTLSSSMVMWSRLGMRVTSIRVSIPLRTPRSSSRIKSVAPATMRALSPRSDNACRTSSIVVAFIYSFHIFLWRTLKDSAASFEMTTSIKTFRVSFLYCPSPTITSDRRLYVSTAMRAMDVRLRIAAGRADSSPRLASTLSMARPTCSARSKKAASYW